jgi:hypothetical protein
LAASNLPSRLVGAGIRAGLCAEQFRLDQLAGQCAAVQRDERSVLHRRVRLDDGGDLLLARPVGTGDEHRQAGARHLAGQRHHAFAGRIREHQPAQVIACGELFLPFAFALTAAIQFAPRFHQFQQVVDRGQ